MTAKKSDLGSDLKKVDAHKITPEEYEEIPELTTEYARLADLYEGERLIRRGRPPLENPKKHINIRLSADVVEALRQTGPGWQTRIDDVLRAWLKRRRRAA